MSESKIVYDCCPVCQSKEIFPVLTAIDYTVSQESFEIYQCGTCTARFTQGIPTAERIGPYYQSDEYISHSNTSQGIVNRMYQVVRGITLKQKRSLVKKSSGLRQGTLLDIGSGTGEFLHTMKEDNWRVKGIEPDDHARNFAIKNYSLQVFEPNALFDLEDGSFQVITMWHVLEHVHDLHAYLSKIHSLLVSKGTLLIAVPNYKASDANHYGEHWAAYDVPRHLYHFTPKSMIDLLKKHRFQFINLKAMPFDGFYVSLLSEKYRYQSNRLVSGGWQGFRSYLNAFNNPDQGSAVLFVARKD